MTNYITNYMLRCSIVFMSAILLATAVSSGFAFNDPAKESADDFLFRFHRTVRDGVQDKKAEANIVTSPYGASCLGEMLAWGAKGETEKALQAVFVPNEGTAKRATWYHLPEGKEGELPFISANGIWIQKDFAIQPAYTTAVWSQFKPEISDADFKKDAAGECRRINDWAARATDNRMTKLFESLNPQSRIVLVNVLSFQGKWAVPFDKNATKPGQFHCTKEKSVNVPFMQKTVRLNYVKNDLYQAVAIPYEKNRCSLVIVLPNETQSLEDVEKSLSEESFARMIDSMVLEQINCIIPSFVVESDIDLKPVLRSMGAGIVFDNQKADFTGISRNEGLYVETMIQKVFFRVDESGTEAAAGTGAAIAPKSVPHSEITPLQFRADRPFLFLIRDNTSGVPLFVGRFVAL